MSKKNEQKTAPLYEVRVRSVKAAVWANTDEKDRVHYGITVSNSYRDRDGKWKTKRGYDFNESFYLMKAIEMAQSWIIHARAGTNGESMAEDSPTPLTIELPLLGTKSGGPSGPPFHFAESVRLRRSGSGFRFRHLIPMPEHDVYDWRKWSIKNWGAIEIRFQTANSPPLPVIRKLLKMFPQIAFIYVWQSRG